MEKTERKPGFASAHIARFGPPLQGKETLIFHEVVVALAQPFAKLKISDRLSQVSLINGLRVTKDMVETYPQDHSRGGGLADRGRR